MGIRKIINSTNIPVQVVPVNSNVLFNVTKIKPTGCGCNQAIVHEAGSGLFTLAEAGIYRVLFSANILVEGTGITAIVDVETNGEKLSEAEIVDFSDGKNYQHVSTFANVIVPCNCCKTVSIGNNSAVPVSFANANIEIKKIY